MSAMETDLSPPAMSAGGTGGGNNQETQQRRERAAIAAQACETCRSRKSKCDESRPKCGLCKRLNVDCKYREPQPTKKDKTLVHILESLQRIENKFDRIAASTSSTSNNQGFDINSTYSPLSQHPSSNFASTSGRSRTAEFLPDDLPDEIQKSYQHVTAAHKVLLWPAIYVHIIDSGVKNSGDLQYVLQEGTPWFLQLELARHPKPLNPHPALPPYPYPPNPHLQGEVRVGFQTLTPDLMTSFANHYFNTYNVLYPLLDRESFFEQIFPVVTQQGFGRDDQSIIALLVFALGKSAIDGTFGAPISIQGGMHSGIRGGSAEEPPGLDIFNEARARIGFAMSQCSLENIQILLLCAIYYEASSRHLDFWRSSVAASMACQVLIKCRPMDWVSHQGDLVKRAYWTCNLIENWYHIDLDLPQTGICDHEDNVPLPTFVGRHNTAETLNTEQSNFQYQFLAIIAIRRLITRIHTVLFDVSEAAEDSDGPPLTVTRELARQLESWRILLPHPLQWHDTNKNEFPWLDTPGRRPSEPMFAPDQGSVPINHTYNLDIVTAQLRTRFYYARFMIYRPFIYKALHFPEGMTNEDYECCVICLNSCIEWPLAMSPPRMKKRLMPYLFAWTQNFMGICLIIRMTYENDTLKQIVEANHLRQPLDITAALMLDWIRDMSQVDGVAQWAWKILDPLFHTKTASSQLTQSQINHSVNPQIQPLGGPYAHHSGRQ